MALAAIVLALCLGAIARVISMPYRGFRGEVFLDIPKGTGTRKIAGMLAERGVIRSTAQFLLVRALRPTARLQAGEYRFAGPASTEDVFDRLVRGDVHYYEFTVPEGSNLYDVAKAVSQLSFLREADVRSAVADPAAVRDIAPQATSLEGYLYPSTYRVTRHTTAKQVIRLMTDQFRRVWTKLGSPASAHEVVTFASLIEKETGRAEERPVVASVYKNRLGRGIKLECDPTTIYAAMLEGRYRGTIYKSDLESLHPYNTYRHTGLPPGPIANPGEASLRAALHPAETDYIFFVARGDGSGGHHFSKSLAQHQAAVAEYRRAQARTNAAPAAAPTAGHAKSGRR